VRTGTSYRVEDDAYHQTTAGAARNVFSVAHVIDGNLEAVATWTWVVVDLQSLIVETVFDLDFVVEVDFFVGHGLVGVRVRAKSG
jgi:hypothetical protein